MSSPSTRSAFLKVRIVNIDHYLAEPGSMDHTVSPFSLEPQPLLKVPIVRVFGSTPAGQKVCLHIHQAFPYFYVPYPGQDMSLEALQAYSYQLGQTINKAMTLSMRKDPNSSQHNQYVVAIVPVKGVPFYGYHVGYQCYLKIYLLKPSYKLRMVELLQRGGVMATFFQPHEAHIPFELQFLMDYNLYGMNWIDLENRTSAPIKFRSPLPEEVKANIHLTPGSNPNHIESIFTRGTVPSSLVSEEYERSSHCELEVDVVCSNIINRHTIQERNIHKDFKEAFGLLKEHEQDFHSQEAKLVHSLAAIWEEESRRRTSRGLSPQVPPVAQEDNRDKNEAWDSESDYRSRIHDRIQNGQFSDEDIRRWMDKVDSQDQDLHHLLTAWEAIAAITPERPLFSNVGATPGLVQAKNDGDLIDESILDTIHFNEQDDTVDEDITDATDVVNDGAKEQESELVDEKYDDDFEDLDDPSVMQWLALQEERTSKRKHVQIAYEDMDDEEDFANIRKDPTDEPETSSATTKPRIRRPRKSAMLDIAPAPVSPSELYAPKPFIAAEPNNDKPFNATIIDQPHPASQLSYMDTINAEIDIPKEFDVINSDSPPLLSHRLPSTHPQNLHLVKPPSGIAEVGIPLLTNEKKRESGSMESTMTSISSEINIPQENPLELYDIEESTQPETNDKHYSVSDEMTYHQPPPSLDSKHHMDIVYQEPYYSDRRDAPKRPKIYAGKEFKLKTLDPCNLEEFSITGSDIVNLNPRKHNGQSEKPNHAESSTSSWTPSALPPSFRDVLKWLEKETSRIQEKGEKKKRNAEEGGRIEPPTPQNRYGIKFVNAKTDSIKPIKEHLDLLSVEIHVNTRENRLPDPRQDPIECIYWCLQTEDENIASNGRLPGYSAGYVSECLPFLSDIDVQYVDDELQLLEIFVSKVRLYDPDILAGYELHNSSWGYIIERCINQYEINLIEEMSRIKPGSVQVPRSDAWGYRKAAIFRIVGRHLLNVWRVMRSEIDLTSYRYENIVFHLLHHRVPHYSYKTLTSWYKFGNSTLKEKVCRYYLDRVQRNLELLDVSNMLSRTTESARTFGIDFYSVITRGSQFKVESMMLRIAKPENFILVSPSRKQVGELSAAECLPLVMEPLSQFYSSPTLVLDFQSLYPSVMIAYNYCYSTCLGKVENFNRDYVPSNQLKYGMDTVEFPAEILKLMEDHINVSPTGLMFVKPSVRKSLLAKMLSEILDTRVMVKRAMGEENKNKGLYRLLDARQLGLKFLANVTYGYTSATFSGRMPAVEIADSIVQTGRETLERAIDVINTTKKWGARVVYGDTDSVFVYLPGRSRDEAFTIGNDIADTITRLNPVPVKLKFEKVYQPCVLVTKKRYVGFKYETRDWKQPEFEAKGIETVRRDGIPATQKMMEQSIRILFRTQDMSEVKSYLQDQWMSILSGRVSEQDFILAQEVRLGEYKEGYESLGARVAMSNMKLDPRAEPQYGDRVPYVIVSRGPNVKLRDKPMSPLAYMADSSLRLDAEYYITKQIIPALERIFNLCGVDIASWYKQMPRRKQALAYSFSQLEEYNGNSRTLEQYYSSRHCVVCRRISENGKMVVTKLCTNCLTNGAQTMFTMKMRLNDVQKRFGSIQDVCQSCSGVLTFGSSTGYADHPCDSIDCPVFFQRQKLKRDVRVLSAYDTIIDRWF
ncbi:DNA polymerase zeta catalytic subunit [Umbelopsis sp. PMI_123]|nr:DNA polymerase zeta catalytic subunit [Umbelopsis sp. PMI_123]